MNEQAGPGPRLNCAVILPKAPPAHWLPSFFSVTSRKAKAVYPCEAEHDSELSFQVGAIFNAGKCYRLHQSLTQNQPWHIGFGGKPNTQSDLQSNREMRRGEGERGGEEGGQETQICSSVCLEEARLSFNHSQRKWGFCSSYFLSKPSFVRARHYRGTIVFTGKHVVMSLIRPHNALQFIGCYGHFFVVVFFFLLEKMRTYLFFDICQPPLSADLSKPSPNVKIWHLPLINID